jgi:hypothetical protein
MAMHAAVYQRCVRDGVAHDRESATGHPGRLETAGRPLSAPYCLWVSLSLLRCDDHRHMVHREATSKRVNSCGTHMEFSGSLMALGCGGSVDGGRR